MLEPDVIAQFNHDGTIIPLRIRVEENGELYSFILKSYKQMDHETGDFHGMYITAVDLAWECKIEVNGKIRIIYLVWSGNKWRMAM